MSRGPAKPHPTAAWVLACQNDDGGFGAFPGDISAVRPTAWALEALRALDIAVPRARAVARFVLSQQNEDGGYRGRPWGLRWTDKSTLANTYYASWALASLGRKMPRAGALARFVRSRRRADGAYLQDLYPETAGVCAETYYAISLLRALGAEPPRAAETIAFLRRMQSREVRRSGGFIAEDSPDWEHLVAAARKWAASVRPYRDPGPDDKRGIPVAVGYARPTHLAARALLMLGGRPPLPRKAISFLSRLQHPGGAFPTGMGDYGSYHDRSEGRMSDTYHALLGLRLLLDARAARRNDTRPAWPRFLASGAIDPQRCAAWIASCQNPDGAFARRPDPTSRPSDLEATAQAARALAELGRPLPAPAAPNPPAREHLPPGAPFRLSSRFFQPDQPGQALYLHRIAAPIRAARPADEATAIDLMRWVNAHLAFHENARSEAAVLIEDGLGACGSQARALAGLLQAVNIPSRFLMVVGHCTTEAFIRGRWCLLDPMFAGAFRRPDGLLCSAFDVHERHRTRAPDITTFGDWRYESYTIYQPKGPGDFEEIAIGADDTAASTGVRAAYPELGP